MNFNLTLDGFKKQIKNGVYIFISPGCFTCEFHLEEFKKQMNGFYIISTMEDPAYFSDIGIEITPTTRIYKQDKLIWSKDGVLFDSQLEDMRKFL